MRLLGGAVVIFIAIVTMGACSSSGSQPAGPATDLAIASGGYTVGRDGARFSVGPVTLDFPDGAVSMPVRITVMPTGPGDLVDPLNETGPIVPGVPTVLSEVRIGPVGLSLSRSVRVMFATAGAGAGLAVASVGPLAGAPAWGWQALAGQSSSPGLLWAQTALLGVFGLVQVTCCTPMPVSGSCAVACDQGGLRYRCEGADAAMDCCDPFAQQPQQGPQQWCPQGDMN